MNREIKQGIRDFINIVNPDLEIKFQKWDLECDVYTDTIYIGRTFDKRTDEYFKNFCTVLNPETTKINLFLLSILHEIGHIETWTEEDNEQKEIIYNLLQTQFNENELNDEKLAEYCNIYFRIPLEKNATEWGINYALTHLELMQQFDWLHN